MKKKVSLREIVANKIVYASAIVIYYWMWARTDWKDWYLTFQYIFAAVVGVHALFQALRIKKYKSEGIDEMAEQNLKRCDSICLKILIGFLIVIAWGSAILGHLNAVSPELIGAAVVLSIFALSIIRTVIFVIMDSKGV